MNSTFFTVSGKPSSASRIAGAITVARGTEPWRSWRPSVAATSPGTPIERGPALRSSAVTRAGSAAAGIRPADTTASRRPRWKTSSVATPPGPDM